MVLNMKIDNNEFLEYLIKNCSSNLTFIKKLRINKKSISIYIDYDISNFIFNEFFTENHLYHLIISYLSNYNKQSNNVSDIDYLKYTYKKLNINYI